jgi:hypothetical protein
MRQLFRDYFSGRGFVSIAGLDLESGQLNRVR